MTGGDPEHHLEGIPWSSGSALTRAGSLTPQWMQSKTPGTSKSDRGLHRASKRAPEERETWKHKERWAAGPDSSRNWTEVPVSGREREGWTCDDALCRSENGRQKDTKLNFEGGYVQKQSKWNDEERSARWSTVLKSRNEASRKRTSPGPWASTHRRNAKTVSPKSTSNGRFRTRTRFSREDLLKIQERLVERTGPVLPLPEGVDVSYPDFLVTEKGDLSQQDGAERDEEQDRIAGVSSMELEADSWVYKDPSGIVRGPYTKEEVLDWWQEGYFTPDLQIQSQVSSKENWIPFKQLLSAWGLSSERVQNPVPLRYPSMESETIDRTLEHVSSLPTVGSHIPVSVLMEAGLDVTSIDLEDSNQKQSFCQSVPVVAESQIPFQNPVPGFQQTMQDLMIQQQRQNQVPPAFNLPTNPGNHFLQNSTLLGTGFNQQSLQESALLTPGVLEALQQRLQQQQDLARSPLQNTGLNFGNPGIGLNTGQFTGNANLASLFRQGSPQTQPTAQQLLQQQNLMSCDSQRLLENRTGIFGAPSSHYPNLESLLQRPQPQFMNLSYPDALTNHLPRQSPPQGAIRENLLSLSGFQNTGSSFSNGILQQARQRSSMSPVNANQSFQQEQDLNLLRQSSANQNYPVKQQSASMTLQDFPVSSSEVVEPKGSLPVVPESHQNPPRGPLSNAWGVSSAPLHPASLLEIQEQEIKDSVVNSQQQIPIKAQDSNPASGVSWNVPRVKPTSLMDIMQEDAASKKQTQGTVLPQQSSTGSKKGPVWSKRPVEAQSLKQDLKKETGNGVSLFSGQISISEDFSKWCEQSLIKLGVTGDHTLIKFLMSLNSRSEIEEYIKEYFPSAPTTKRSTFISEFLNRKAADENRTQEKTKSSTLARTGSGNKQMMTSRVKESKPKGKKTVKGQHLPPDMLGFKSNVNLDSRYRSGSIG